MAKEKILIVDDDPAIRIALRTAFKRENMETVECASGEEALRQLQQQTFDLVILDIMMEDMDGYTVLQKIRAAQNSIPVLMLSGRQSEVDQVLGLGLGADDYLTKPFHVAILIQKVKALIRRNQVYAQQRQQKELSVGPFRFDQIRLECYRGQELIPFTGRELTLFRFFLEHPGQVFTKEQLYAHVWNESVVDDNTIMVYIKRIRQKIGDSSRDPRYIRNVRGIGYVFEAE